MAGMVTIVTFNGSQIEVKLAMLVSDAIDDKNFTDWTASVRPDGGGDDDDGGGDDDDGDDIKNKNFTDWAASALPAPLLSALLSCSLEPPREFRPV